MPTSCDQCHKSDTNQLYGLTIQKTAQWIEENYKIKPLTIDAEQVSSSNKANRILEQMKTSQITISTNIIIPPESNNLFDLIIVLAADQ
jgi:primosomal protein N'